MRLCVSSSTVSLNASLGLWLVSAEHVVLRFHDAGQRAHQHAAFAGQVAEHFVLERGREQIAGADADADRQAAFFGAAGGVLLDGEAGIDARAGEEIAAHVRPEPFGATMMTSTFLGGTTPVCFL